MAGVQGSALAVAVSNASGLGSLPCAMLSLAALRDELAGGGHAQVGGCLKALRELEVKGWFQLPPPQIQKSGPAPRRLSDPVAEPEGVPREVGEAVGLELILVEQESQMRIWNELMIREHPQGAGPLVGRQVRYLINSAHGWLGRFGFAAPALQLADRDRWVGWDGEQRRAHLHGIVCLSRFLVRPSVEYRNLASRLLSMSRQRVVEDFQQRYHGSEKIAKTGD